MTLLIIFPKTAAANSLQLKASRQVFHEAVNDAPHFLKWISSFVIPFSSPLLGTPSHTGFNFAT